MPAVLKPLRPAALRRFQELHADAVKVVSNRLYAEHGEAFEQSGARGREACREDLAFHLEFLRPVLEFGLLQPMVDYLSWLGSVLATRAIPLDHLALSLDLLAEFFAEQMELADSVVVISALHAARTEFLRGASTPAEPRGPEAWPEVEAFEASLLAGHQHAALAVMNRCLDAGHSLVEVEMHVIQPALYRIGEKWQANQVTVAKEHMATAIAQSVMTIGLLRSPPPVTIGKRVLLACVQGNEHAIGLRMVADAFQLAGWDVCYLGADVPTPSLIREAADWHADLVGLSVSFAQHLRIVRDVIAQLADQLGANRPAVMIGGLAINRFSRLADMVGADACGSDAHAAVVSGNRMVSV